MFEYIRLSTDERSPLETEVRFLIASATVDEKELLTLAFDGSDDTTKRRTSHHLRRILNALKKEGKISFYVDQDNLDSGSTEAEFLKNKYPEQLVSRNNDAPFYVKL